MRKQLTTLLFLFTFYNCFSQNPYPVPELQYDSEDPRKKVYERLEEQAKYKDGDNAWKNYIDSSTAVITKSKKAIFKKGTYEVVVKFIINIDGSVSEIKALTSFGNGLEESCIDVIKKAGKWKPGIQNGWEVNSYRTQKFIFAFD